MPELPKGTVTFLFTDIEGSTRLLKQLGDRYGEVLADHERLLRAAFKQAGGQEIDTQGDAFFVVFTRGRDAVAAAVAAQRALAEHPWPEGTAVSVRMGIHTGEPALGTGRYIGLGVHRAARICSAGHGGQVLLSNATRELVADDLPEDVRLRDLGEHVLKDLDRPERIFQVVIDGLPADFPSLKSIESQPAQATPFGEREAELAEAAATLVSPPLLSGRRGMFVLAALAGVVAAAVSISVFALGRGDSGGTAHFPLPPDSVGFIDPETNQLAGHISVDVQPTRVAVGQDKVWVTNAQDQTVSVIDPEARRVVRTVPLESAPRGLAVDATGAWTGQGSLLVDIEQRGAVALTRIDPISYETRTAPVVPRGNGPFDVAVGGGYVWVSHGIFAEGTVVSQIRPSTRGVVENVPLPGAEHAGVEQGALAVGAGYVWVVGGTDTVIRIDPETLVDTPITIASGSEGEAAQPIAIAVGEGAVWVANRINGTVSRIDPEDGTVDETIEVGGNPSGIAAGEGAVWVADSTGEAVHRIDPDKNEVVETIELGRRPDGIAVGDGYVWVTAY